MDWLILYYIPLICYNSPQGIYKLALKMTYVDNKTKIIYKRAESKNQAHSIY